MIAVGAIRAICRVLALIAVSPASCAGGRLRNVVLAYKAAAPVGELIARRAYRTVGGIYTYIAVGPTISTDLDLGCIVLKLSTWAGLADFLHEVKVWEAFSTHCFVNASIAVGCTGLALLSDNIIECGVVAEDAVPIDHSIWLFTPVAVVL